MTIELKRGQLAQISAEDNNIVSGFVWYYLPSSGYVATSISHGRNNVETVFLHRLIMGLAKGDSYVDHINGDKLDNRRENLRVVSNTQNQWNTGIGKRNTSGFKGVSYDKKNDKWFATISMHGKQKALGRFSTPEQAAEAYNKAVVQRGEYAVLNRIGDM